MSITIDDEGRIYIKQEQDTLNNLMEGSMSFTSTNGVDFNIYSVPQAPTIKTEETTVDVIDTYEVNTEYSNDLTNEDSCDSMSEPPLKKKKEVELSNKEKIENFLLEVGLPQLIPNFVEHEIEYENIQHLDDEDLRVLAPVINQKIILKKRIYLLFKSAQKAIATSSEDKRLTLEEICERHEAGVKFLDVYRNQHVFNEQCRKWITHAITDYYYTIHGRHFGHEVFMEMTDIILECLPSEMRENWYTPIVTSKGNGGRLHSRHRYLVKKSKEMEYKPIPEEQTTAKLFLRSMDTSNEEEVLKNWELSFDLRRKEILEAINVTAEWPVIYKFERPYVLIDKDFEHLFPEKCENLQLLFEDFIDRYKRVYKTRITDENALKLLEKLDDPEIKIDLRNFLILYNFSFFFRGVLVIQSGDKQFHPTLLDVRNSFILVINGDFELKQTIEQLRKRAVERGILVRPFIIAVGNPNTGFSKYYVSYDNYLYLFHKILPALDFCFKIHIVLNLPYSPESLTVWLFIEKYFFGITTKYSKTLKIVSSVINDFK